LRRQIENVRGDANDQLQIAQSRYTDTNRELWNALRTGFGGIQHSYESGIRVMMQNIEKLKGTLSSEHANGEAKRHQLAEEMRTLHDAVERVRVNCTTHIKAFRREMTSTHEEFRTEFARMEAAQDSLREDQAASTQHFTKLHRQIADLNKSVMAQNGTRERFASMAV
jgi:SPX domain protein involved in polyphosphate accumulation